MSESSSINERGRLLIRADVNAQMGTGPLMRCLALGQAWQAQGGNAIFVTVCDSEGVLQRLRGEDFRTFELEKTHPDLDEGGVSWDAWQALAKARTGNPETELCRSLTIRAHFSPLLSPRSL